MLMHSLMHIFKSQCIQQHKCTHAQTHVHLLSGMHTDTHTRMHRHARTHARTHRLVCQGDGTEEKVFKQRTVFKADLKELTEVER